jgi:hypothetical protein
VKLNLATAIANIVLPNVSVVGSGTDTVVATYAGDTLYPATTTNEVNLETVSTADFSITSATASQTVIAGNSAAYTIAITPANGFNSAVTFTATGLPPGATAVFTPASVTPSGTSAIQSTLVIQTAASTTGTTQSSAGNRAGWSLGFALAFPLGIVVLGGQRRRIGRRLPGWIFAAIVLFGLLGLGGCSGNSGFFGPQPTTYTVTVTATSGSLTHSTAVTLTVK